MLSCFKKRCCGLRNQEKSKFFWVIKSTNFFHTHICEKKIRQNSWFIYQRWNLDNGGGYSSKRSKRSFKNLLFHKKCSVGQHSNKIPGSACIVMNVLHLFSKASELKVNVDKSKAFCSRGGACGFGEYGRTVNDGSVAAVSRLWRNGTGCGACYQARCKLEQYCDEEGTYVVVTDYGEGDRTDFVLSPRAYKKLGRNDEAAAELFKYGVVDIEYRRVPCRYEGYNIVFKVHERSKNPEYFAVVILYVNGAYDVTAVQLWQEDCQEWTEMRRVYGAVFDYANPPSGEINLRFQVSGSAGIYWVQSQNAIPSDWTAGAAYDSQVQLT